MRHLEDPRVHVGKAARILMSELGLDVETVMRRVGLPSGLLDGDGGHVSLDDYHGLWASLTTEANDPLLALKLGDAAGITDVDPAFFAAMCSQDMNMAATRLAEHKRRISPFTLDVQVDDHATRIAFRGPANTSLHPTLALTESVFLVSFARRATRHPIRPMSVSMPFDVPDRPAFEAHFGCPILRADLRALTFDGADARRPFVTQNDEIWALFEPRLQRQVAGGSSKPSVRSRVSQCLNAFLPRGRASIEDGGQGIGDEQAHAPATTVG